MALHIGINGFGRLGRVFFRTCFEYDQLQVTAINDPIIDLDYICYLIKFDSTHGNFKGTVEKTENGILVNGKTVQVFHHKKPQFIPWYLASVDYVIESSGMFTTLSKASLHLERGRRASAGVRRVIVTSPSIDAPVIILGVNHDLLCEDMRIISCASSTLYCLAPLVKVLDDHFGVVEGMMTSVHAMTPALKPLDGFCSRSKHWRDHRGALQNIIPATSGACRVLGQLLPHLQGKLSGIAYRVPVVDVSVLDLTVRLKNTSSISEITACIDRASRTNMENIIRSTHEETVSSDFIGDKHSCIFDVNSSIALNEHFFKLVCWYENEYSYACRVAELIIYAENSNCRPLPTKKFNLCMQREQQVCEAPISNAHNKNVTNTFIVPVIKAIINRQRNLSPFRLKSLCIQDNRNLANNNVTTPKENESKSNFTIDPKKNCFDFENGEQFKRVYERCLGYQESKKESRVHQNMEINQNIISSSFGSRDPFISDRAEDSGGLGDSYLEENEADTHKISYKIVEIENVRQTSKNNIFPAKQLNKKNIDASVSVELECDDFCKINFRELSGNGVTVCLDTYNSKNNNNKTLLFAQESNKSHDITACLDAYNLENKNNETLLFEQGGSESPELINDTFIKDMLTVSYSKDSTAFEKDDFVYFVGEPMRERIPIKLNGSTYLLDNYNGDNQENTDQIGQICSKNKLYDDTIVEDTFYYVNSNKLEVPSNDNIDILTVFESQKSIMSIDKCPIVSKQLDKIKVRAQELCEKVDSSSDTDSENSFQIHEKKSMEIKLSDITDSLEELEKLDRICKIIEISEDMTDNLFKKLEDNEHKVRANEQWSLKEFCDRIQLDDFFNSTFLSK